MKKTPQKVGSISDNHPNSPINLAKPNFTPSTSSSAPSVLPKATHNKPILPGKTSLYYKLLELVRSADPFSLGVDVFTALANRYYYAEQAQIGVSAANDFATAPELGSLFARSLALWATDRYLQYIASHEEADELLLLELGPGNGTLMYDFIEGLQQFSEIRTKPIHVFCLENSELLQKKQHEQLLALQKKLKITIKHNFASDINELAAIIDASRTQQAPTKKPYLFLLANEFFDALPSKQFAIYSKNSEFAHEITLGANEEGLVFTHAPQPTHNIAREFTDIKTGIWENLKFIPNNGLNSTFKNETLHKTLIQTCHIAEQSPVAMQVTEVIAQLFRLYPGAGVIIDYGYINSPGKSTLQAIRKQGNCGSVLPYIGQADISHLVNFHDIKNILHKHGLNCTLSSQKSFLIRNCIDLIYQKARQTIAKQSTPTVEQLAKLELQYNQLISPQSMGELFKCLEFISEG